MKILLFGDTLGIPQLLHHVPHANVCGIVVAANRPHGHIEMRKLAVERELPFTIQPLPSNDDYSNFRQWVQALQPDLIWVNSYSMIIREDILSVSRLGGVNIHGALLPQYRGCNPMQWAIINYEMITGVTLHEMVAGVDGGAIIAQKYVPLCFDDTWNVLQARIVQAADTLIVENLPAMLTGTWKAELQDETKAGHCRRRKAEDGRFEWQQPLVDIYNLIRALVAPHPGAFYLDASDEKQLIDFYMPLPLLLAEKFTHVGGGYMRAEQIRLRPVKHEDRPLLYEWITDRSLLIFNAPYYPVSEADHDRWFECMLTKRSDLVFFMIERLSDGQTIGSCQLMNINWVHRSAELQIRIGETGAQGQGAGSEVVRLLCEFGFNDLNLHRIYLQVFATNTRAISVYEKNSFVREGLLREAVHIDGQWGDVTCMARLKGST